MKTEEVGVINYEMEAGCFFPDHVHDMDEFVVVYRGEIEICYEGDDCRLKKGDMINMKRLTKHSAVALTPVGLIAITIPADEGWPDVP